MELPRRFAVLDAPSNLGLRPPEAGSVPGCHKAPGMLRDLGLIGRLGARDAGVLTPPRYRAEWTPGTVRNESAIAEYSQRLADRIRAIRDAGETPIVLGGDCSILLGACLDLRRSGRYGLAFLDGHLDYRHPGNSGTVGAAAGEDLALATGLGGVLAELDGSRPYIQAADTVALGFRAGDEAIAEAGGAGMTLIDATAIRHDAHAAAADALRVLEGEGIDGFWIHIDADIIDASLLPAVDSPETNGLNWNHLVTLAGSLLASPRAVGLELTVYDPDLDPEGEGARHLVDTLVRAAHSSR